MSFAHFASAYGFCLSILRGSLLLLLLRLFSFFNFLGIIDRLWLPFSTARIMAEVVNKTRDRNVRDSTLDSLCCRCCHRLFVLFVFFLLFLVFRSLFLFVFVLILESESRVSIAGICFRRSLLATDRKQKQNWRMNCRRPRPSSDCERRRCRSRWWNEPSRFSFKNKKSCGRKRSWTPKSVDRPKPRNSSKKKIIIIII